MKYFSKSTRGFYDEELHGVNMPADAVPVSQKRFAELWDGHMQGKQIVGDAEGNPTLVDPVQEQLPYNQLRKMSYPDIGDQLDDLFRAGAFSPEMAAKIQAIKDQFPKG